MTSDDVSEAASLIGQMAEAVIVYSYGLQEAPKMTGMELAGMFNISYQKVSVLKRLGLLMLRSTVRSEGM
jgi:hypothetical protein